MSHLHDMITEGSISDCSVPSTIAQCPLYSALLEWLSTTMSTLELSIQLKKDLQVVEFSFLISFILIPLKEVQTQSL